MNRAIRNGELKAIDFAAITRNTYGLDAVEYVNGFYTDHKTDQAFWDDMKNRAEGEGVKNLLIMVDAEGELGNADDSLLDGIKALLLSAERTVECGGGLNE